ncbi:ThuA domain-containing protein [Salegentibacter mishustinae]|uniref:ThuA domain-containing protein n=1 Tax=Salegentibacter mishustinae TaxID=270918 RepID=UPI001CE1DAB2|nr:ThuA domain-containing protein [Salegentibacter mishustinae]UBZ05598.1 ThuA domain-containing protein [Salegentibacter mishustinae]
MKSFQKFKNKQKMFINIKFRVFLILVLTINTFFSCSAQNSEGAILVFSKTAGWYHESIPAGNAALIKLGQENNIKVDTTTNAEFFTEKKLKNYDAVIFLSTTGDVFNDKQKKALKRYIQAGNGFVGIHGASDTEHNWPWYGKMVGAYFENHPEVQEAVLVNHNQDHPSTAHLPKKWRRTDEYYNFYNLNPEVNVLLTIDEDSYQGGAHQGYHPMAWYHEYDGGRAFYTALGHLNENFSDPFFLQHLLGGIHYAMGEGEKSKR